MTSCFSPALLRISLTSRISLPALGLALLLLMSSGCEFSSQGGGESAGPELPDWLTQEATTDPASTSTTSAELSLKLKVGDRFPLKKTVEQTLTQNTVSGNPGKNEARLELMFGITVEAVEADRTRLSVRYDRVRYTHHIAGEQVEYDSTYPPNPVPLHVRAYHDMIGDGFSFWLGKDNQIAEVVGFSEFVDRCLRNIPPEQRTGVMLGIEAGSGETGFANFIDHSIGLLPVGKKQTPGDSWERTNSIQRPVPMHINTTYTLQSLSPDFAVVDIRESITPSTAVAAIDDTSGVRITVLGGESAGSCTIFRDTGLPRQSKVERTVNMQVLMSGSISFNQTKKIVTSVESFPAIRTQSPTVLGLQDAQTSR
jgi:hypothetical protein